MMDHSGIWNYLPGVFGLFAAVAGYLMAIVLHKSKNKIYCVDGLQTFEDGEENDSKEIESYRSRSTPNLSDLKDDQGNYISIHIVSNNRKSLIKVTDALEKGGVDAYSVSESTHDFVKSKFNNNVICILDAIDPSEQPQAVRQALGRDGSIRVLVLAENFDIQPMIDCFAAGAQGYIVKSNDHLPFIASLALIAAGERVLPSESAQLMNDFADTPHVAAGQNRDIEAAKLSPREIDVLCCLMAGYSNRVISRKLDIPEAAVKVHVRAILRKLKVSNPTKAAIWGAEHGVAKLSDIEKWESAALH